MSLNDSRMLPARIRNMRQMNDVLNAEDIILAEIERMIDEMYQRASLLHEELVNEAWLESKLSARTGAIVDVVEYGEQLLVDFVLDVSAVTHIDMKDVRMFIEKWLPAHLMYRLNLLLAYEVCSTERFNVSGVGIQCDAFFWNIRTLDGSWILDGSYDLNVVRQRNTWGLKYSGGTNHISERFRLSVGVGMKNLQTEDVTTSVRLGCDSFFWQIRTLDGTWNIDGQQKVDVIRKPDKAGINVNAGETKMENRQSCGVVVVRDLWLLDGSYKLNGTKNVDALYVKEEL